MAKGDTQTTNNRRWRDSSSSCQPRRPTSSANNLNLFYQKTRTIKLTITKSALRLVIS